MAMEPFDPDMWGDWEDNDDDKLLAEATQKLEEEQWQQLRGGNAARGSGSSGPSMTPKLAAQVFNSRREMLHQTNAANRDPMREVISEEAASQIDKLKEQFALEKNRNNELVNQLLAAQGESNNLRRQLENTKQTQQEELFGRLQRQREEKQRYEDEKKELQKQLTALTTDLRVANNEITKLKSKSALNVTTRSVGGAQSQLPVKITSTSAATSRLSNTQPPKYRSDPNLLPSASSSSRAIPVSPPAATKAKVSLNDQEIQADVLANEQNAKDEKLFSGSPAEAEVLNIRYLDEIESLLVTSKRREIFQNIRELIWIDFQQTGKALIEFIVAKAPKQIMARFTRGVEIKTCFPDLIENLFLYGVQVQKRKEQQEKGEYVEKQYPKLKSGLPPILNMDDVIPIIESSFVHDSAWLALKEIKKQMKVLLSELTGENRFRLYEYPNLKALWELLVWTRHLWKFILFEEEFEENLNKHGKDVWIEELKGWTGLVLKIDWRDYYVLELEKLIRGISLSILEIIVTAGYFDSSQRRYEILYCILKDTLLKDHLRNDLFVRRCLNIIAWSNSDSRNILNYLCINNNDSNCLARILGEYVLKCFKETKNDYRATSLLLCYFHLLESLMMEHYPHCFSNIARPPHVAVDSDSESEEDGQEGGDGPAKEENDDAVTDMDMDTTMFSQFACTEKYKFEEGVSERAKRFNNVKAASCWINPELWERDYDKTKSKDPENAPCQCRKILLGSTFVMLYQVVEWWKSAIINREYKIEKRQAFELMELQRLKELAPKTGKEGEQSRKTILNLSKKIESLQKHLIALSSEDAKEEECMEQTWNAILGSWNPPEDMHPSEHEKLIPKTIFDLAVRNGILLMSFCNIHAQNIAMAAGSEAFNCFTLLISETKAFEDQPCFSDVEKRFLLEIIKSGEDETELQNDSDSLTDDEEEEEPNTSFIYLSDLNDGKGLSFEGFPEIEERKFSEEDFDRAAECMEREIAKIAAEP